MSETIEFIWENQEGYYTVTKEKYPKNISDAEMMYTTRCDHQEFKAAFGRSIVITYSVAEMISEGKKKNEAFFEVLRAAFMAHQETV